MCRPVLWLTGLARSHQAQPVQLPLASPAPWPLPASSRYLSLERLLAFLVMFHAMARRTASFWPLRFDIARSQSGLRVATTAAPVTAAELEQSLAEILGSDVMEERFVADQKEHKVRSHGRLGGRSAMLARVSMYCKRNY